MADILFDNGATLIVRDGPARTERRAFVFGSYGHTDPIQPSWPDAELGALDYDIIGVRSRSNNWFQDLSRDDLAAVAAALPTVAQTITIGSDMGGYGACYFAEAVGASAVLVASPQIGIDPALVPWEQRWGDAGAITFNHAPMAMALAGSGAAVLVVADPLTDDARHAEMIAEMVADGRFLPFRYSGHPAREAVLESGLLPALIAAVTGTGDLPDAAAVRHGLRGSPTYLKTLAMACDRHGHVAAAETLFARAVAANRRPDILLEASNFFSRRERPAAALPLMAEAITKMPPNPHLYSAVGHLEEATGNLDGAAASFARAVELDPDEVVFYRAERRVLREQIATRIDMPQGVASANTAPIADLAMLDRLRADERHSGTLTRQTAILGVLAPFVIVLLFAVVGRAMGWI